MARARNIKPGFFKNEDLAECSIWARYIYPGLWMLADREGRMEDRPKRIKGELLPFDAQDVDPLLRELDARRFILRYEVGGVHYIQILRFKAHQTPHYSEKDSVIPAPPLREIGPNMSGADSKKKPLIKRGSQPPDSLNPDSPTAESLVPNPDSPKPLSGGATATASTGSPPLNRAAAIAVLLRNLEKTRGKAPKITSMDPRVVAWAQQGVTDAQLTEAYELAVAERESKGDAGPINAGFLDVFIAKLLNPPTATTRVNGHGKPWFLSWPEIVAKGAEKGLKEADFTTSPEFRDAVYAAHGVTLDDMRKAEREWKDAA